MSLTQMSFHPNESTFKPFFWTLNNNSKAPQVTTYMQSSFYPKSHSQCARRPVAIADRRSSPGTAPNMQCMYTTVSSLSVQEQADYHVPKLVPGKFSNEKKQRPRVSTPVLQAAHFFYYSSQKLSLSLSVHSLGGAPVLAGAPIALPRFAGAGGRSLQSIKKVAIKIG